MTNKTLEALALAEVALMDVFDYDNVKQALDAIREAKAQGQSAQEPVAVIDYKKRDYFRWMKYLGWQNLPDGTPLYAAPLAQQDTHATHVVRTKDLTDTPENGELERLHGYID